MKGAAGHWIAPRGIAAHLRDHGFFEASLIDWCRQFGRADGCFVDVGAHVGSYALTLAPHFARVHAFEPQLQTWHALAVNVMLRDGARVEVHRVALGAEAGTADLRVCSSDGGGSSLFDWPDRAAMRTEAVEVRPLDSYELPDVAFIKIDAEGAELDVLRGAAATLKRCQPRVLFEVWTEDWYAGRRREIEAWLADAGFDVVPIRGYPHMRIATPLECRWK